VLARHTFADRVEALLGHAEAASVRAAA
jgi:hypothetical protein